MAALNAVLDLRASPFASKLAGAVELSGTAAKKMQAQWAAHSVFLEQQIAAGTRAGVATSQWTRELEETNIALRELSAVSTIATAASRAGTIATNASAFATANWRRAGTELIVILREMSRGNISKIPSSLSILFQSLGTAIFSLINPLTLVTAAAGWFTFELVKIANAAERAYEVQGRLDGIWKYTAESLQKAADRAREFHRWLEKLDQKQENLAQSTQDTLSAMRRQFDLQQRAAKAQGQTPDQAAAERQDQLERERDFITDQVQEAQRRYEQAKAAAQKAEKDAEAGPASDYARMQARRKQLNDQEKIASDAEKAEKGIINKFARAVSPAASGKAHDLNVERQKEIFETMQGSIAVDESRQKEMDENVQDLKGKSAEAKSALEQIQRMASTRDFEDVDVPPQEEKGQHSSRRLERGRITQLQEIGGYIGASNVSIIDVQNQQLKELKEANKHLKELNKKTAEHHVETQHFNRTGGHGF